MEYKFEKYNVEGWQGRPDYIKLNTRAIYIPNYTLRKIFKDISRVSIWYDKDENTIKLEPDEAGLMVRTFRESKNANIGTSLARVMPRGWYIWKEDLMFVLSKRDEVIK